MKEARPGPPRGRRCGAPGVAFEGESTLALARVCDHHLSWAQWFCDSPVPGVLRARWFEQQHMLHHTRRWNRDHLEELHSAWLNGVGMLVGRTSSAHGSAGTSATRRCCGRCSPSSGSYAELLATGEWTPLAPRARTPRVVASRWTRRRDDVVGARQSGRGLPRRWSESWRSRSRRRGSLRSSARTGLTAGGGDASFPARETTRVPVPVARPTPCPTASWRSSRGR